MYAFVEKIWDFNLRMVVVNAKEKVSIGLETVENFVNFFRIVLINHLYKGFDDELHG